MYDAWMNLLSINFMVGGSIQSSRRHVKVLDLVKIMKMFLFHLTMNRNLFSKHV